MLKLDVVFRLELHDDAFEPGALDADLLRQQIRSVL